MLTGLRCTLAFVEYQVIVMCLVTIFFFLETKLRMNFSLKGLSHYLEIAAVIKLNATIILDPR